MKQGQFHEKYLKNPQIPENIPFFWYILSGFMIVALLGVMIFSWTREKPVVESSTEVRR